MGLKNRLDLNFVYSCHGKTLMLQMVVRLLCLILAAPARGIGTGYFGLGHNKFFLWITSLSFLAGLIWFSFHLFKVNDLVPKTFPFKSCELVSSLTAALFQTLAWVLLLAGFNWCIGNTICDKRVAAAVFSLVNSIASGFEAYTVAFQAAVNTVSSADQPRSVVE